MSYGSDLRKLIGKKIVGLKMHPFRTRNKNDRQWTYDPEIILDDGTVIRFSVDETEVGEYGVRIAYPGRKT